MVIKFKTRTQSVQSGTVIPVPNAQISPSSSEVSPKKKRIAKPVRAIQPTPEQLEGEAIWRTGHVLWVLGINHTVLWHRLQAGYFPAPSGKNPRPYWNASVIRDYLKMTPEGYVRLVLEKQIEKHPDYAKHRRASMRASIANMKRGRTLRAEQERQRERQARADAEYQRNE
jgi:hypothetical protein